MSFVEKYISSVGTKLITSIIVILFFTILSIIVATLAINKIDTTQRLLTKQSLPALVEVNQLSSITSRIVEKSLLMREVDSVDELDKLMSSIQSSISRLKKQVDIIKNYSLSNELVSEVDKLLYVLDSNVHQLYIVDHKKLQHQKDIDKDIITMLYALDAIEDKISLIKINAKEILMNKLSSTSTSNSANINQLIQGEIYDIESISDIILRVGELRKDLNSLEISISAEKLLFIKREFNNSLRHIIRILVQTKNQEISKSFGDSVNVLISLGQDSPDIFDEIQRQITLSKKLNEIAKENINYTEQLNTAIFNLVNLVKNNAIDSSESLHSLVFKSALSLYAIGFIAIMVSLFISWQFIYKNIVKNLKKLSNITKKLSNSDFDYSIDIYDDGEFKDIAQALESLREHSIKRIYLNKTLEKQSIKLKQSNQDLSQFAYIASHDLQEPLRMIGSYVQLLRKRYHGHIDQNADIYINFAVDGCTRMKELIEGLLQYSRVESNTDEVLNIDCNEILQEVLQDLSITINESNARIKVDKLPVVVGIRSQVRIIFSNLIGNALKYCEADNPNIHIGSKVIGDQVEFFVKDNGIGIKPQYQDKIFIIFKRLHSRSEYTGTGIGLSISKKIVDRHGGKMRVKSTINQGSTFYFTLPMSADILDMQKIAV